MGCVRGIARAHQHAKAAQVQLLHLGAKGVGYPAVGSHLIESLTSGCYILTFTYANKNKKINNSIFRARDPKHCVVRIVKSKVERTQNHQWLHASRTRATLVVKRRDTIQGQNLQVPFAKISVEDRAQDLLERFSVEAAVQDPCVRLSVPGVFMRSPQKIFVRDLKVRTPSKTSLSSPGPCTRSPKEVSWQDL